MPLTVRDFLSEKSADLHLEICAGSDGLSREISVTDLNRPGLALGGFFENFRWERIQVLGRGELAYINQVALKQGNDSLKEFFKFKIPCIILTHRMQPRPELVELCNQFHVPLVVSGLETATLIAELSSYLEERISPTITLHGVLVDVYGLGVLISGNSGIGKSECALELIKRGHMLVSDDVVMVQHRSGGVLIGKPANEMMKHHMEVRGLGIIDVKQLFGVSAILDNSRIELAVHLEMWEESKEYDRVGLEEHSLEMLGVRVPRIIMPVRPGRNLAILIEVAALYQRLKVKGINVAEEMEKNLLQMLSQPAPGTPRPEGGTTPPARPHRDEPRRSPYRRR
jgi:HPr kinase/phosphorylase